MKLFDFALLFVGMVVFMGFGGVMQLLIASSVPDTVLSVSSDASGVVGGYDVRSTLTCSGSMLPMLDCGDLLYGRYVSDDEYLKTGGVYVYNGTPTLMSERVVHRLIGCANDDCSLLVFKGDHNEYADPVVDRSDLLWEVEYVRFA